MSPEQQNFIENFYNMFDSGGVHKNILNVEPLFYQGAIAATEFLVYSVNKLYLAYILGIDWANQNVSQINLTIYNEANTLSYTLANNYSVYNVANTNSYQYNNEIEKKNIYFSRIISNNCPNMLFNGYRITLN
jgi:hypothetical protein